ncbi:MAG: type V CRISPR-associated endonuclease Cas1 [Chitinispirillales bacterium]|jgi:CRISPR-associated endonuclease Cas1|nr:type V CRISPR-associated endonuclease Cas1 [Chitinispirillales bacterium]
MFTHKDIRYRSIIVVNSREEKSFRVSGGVLLLEDKKTQKTLTKFPFQKILSIFIVGNATITTPLIEKCTKFGVSIVALKTNLRPVFFYSSTAEANFLLRKRQYEYTKENLQIPKILVENKIANQIKLLEKTRIRSELIQNAKEQCQNLLSTLPQAATCDTVMGIEGKASAIYFNAYFEPFDWKMRRPRTKIDPINATLDIGYTILFNFIETFIRLFGFDPYRGVYHQLWFKRKSLVCDLVEPFRCLIDWQTRKAFNTKQCKAEDFNFQKNEYTLKREVSAEYVKMFYDLLVEHKNDIFIYMQKYYRAFMRQKVSADYPKFLI